MVIYLSSSSVLLKIRLYLNTLQYHIYQYNSPCAFKRKQQAFEKKKSHRIFIRFKLVMGAQATSV